MRLGLEISMLQLLCFLDCQDAYERNYSSDGVYLLLNPSGGGENVRAYCEFDDSHGWTVIQRRIDGSVDFWREWNDYVAGFGDVNGEYWLGG